MLKRINWNVENLTFLYNPLKFVLQNILWATKDIKSENQINEFQLITYNGSYIYACHS